MKDMFKFDLGDKVFVKSQGVEGTIVGKRWESSRQALTIDYEVVYQYDCTQDHMYMGKKNICIRVLESDLESLSEYYSKEIAFDKTLHQQFFDGKHYLFSNPIPASHFLNQTKEPVMDHLMDTIYVSNSDMLDAVNYSMAGICFLDDNPEFIWNPKIECDVLSTDSPETISEKMNTVLLNFDYTKVSEQVKTQSNPVPTVFHGVPCDHKWLPYEGLTQRFDYCEKCDLKRG